MFDLNLRQQKELLFFSGIALLYVFPIIHADIYFFDDLTRVVNGYTDWEDQGRPLASISQLIISASRPSMLLDVAPLTQLIAAFLLALSAFQFNEYLKRDHKKGVLLASALIIVNPFFLSNLSYRYDSFSMALGLFLAVLAFCLPLKSRLGSGTSLALLVASLSLYQSGINIFIALVAIEMLLLSNQNDLKLIWSRLLTRMGQYCIACLLYFVTIGQIFTNERSRSRGTLIEFGHDGIASVFANLELFGKLWMSFFTPVNAFCFSILILFILRDFDRVLQSSENKKIQVLTLLIALSLYFISLFGPMILLQNSHADYRTMPSFYMFAPLLIIISSKVRDRFSFVWLIALILPISLSYQYGVAAKNQRIYETRISTLVQYDLLNHHVDHMPVYIIGGFKRAPNAELISLSQPIIANLIRPLSGWMAEGFFQGSGLSSTQFFWDRHRRVFLADINYALCNKADQLITSNSMYSIYTTEQTTYVLLSTNRAKYCQSLN